MKKIWLLTFALAGCSSSGSLPVYDNYYRHPDVIKCPGNMFAYCEGRQRSDMVCECIDRQDQRRILEQLQGIL